MCGIGFIATPTMTTWGAQKERITRMLLGLESRGGDASGIALINSDSDLIHVIKSPDTASSFIRSKQYTAISDEESFNVALVHTRSATTGDKKDNRNNHPIYIKSCNAILVHNGIISNEKELKEQYKLQTDGEVDSEVIGSMFSLFKGNITKAISKLTGSMAFILYHKGRLFMYNHVSPIVVAYLPTEKSLIGASTQEVITHAVSDVVTFMGLFSKYSTTMEYVPYEPANNTLITLDMRAFMLKHKSVEPASYTYSNSYYNGKKWNPSTNEWEELKDTTASTTKPSKVTDAQGRIWKQRGKDYWTREERDAYGEIHSMYRLFVRGDYL